MVGLPSGDLSATLASGLILGEFFDNFTRLSHSHSLDHAKQLWRFAQDSFASVVDFIQSQSLNFALGNLGRVILTQHEFLEATRACQELSAIGVSAALFEPGAPEILGRFGRFDGEIRAVQIEDSPAGFVEPTAFGRALDNLHGAVVYDVRVVAAGEVARGMRMQLETGQVLSSELLVIADAQAAMSLLPGWTDILIPYSDQWLELKFPDHGLGQGSGLILNHGADSLVATDKDTLRVCGGRVLRRLAGIGDEVATINEKSTSYLVKQLNLLWGLRDKAHIERVIARRDIRPCDELPLIGPMYGTDRILVAGGFMGQELTFGFAAGKCLAELIAKGSCSQLPRCLWPERQRSLRES